MINISPAAKASVTCTSAYKGSSLVLAIALALHSRPRLRLLLGFVSRSLLRAPGRKNRGPVTLLLGLVGESAMYEWVAHCEPASGLFEMMRAELERERLAREIAEEDAKDAKAEVSTKTVPCETALRGPNRITGEMTAVHVGWFRYRNAACDSLLLKATSHLPHAIGEKSPEYLAGDSDEHR